MEIELKGFRCHMNGTFTIKNNENTSNLYLVNGQSGIGKSTIFQAIAWVLYGFGRNLASYDIPKTQKIYVKLTIGNMSIYRQKHPELLKVIIKNKEELLTIEDDQAQNYIEEKFASREAWHSCCYLSQFQRNWLLDTSNNEKMSILNNIAFHKENPQSMIETIEKKISEQSTLYKIEETQYKNECEKFQNKILSYNNTTNGGIDYTITFSEEERKVLENIDQDIPFLENKKLDQIHIEGQMKQIEKIIQEDVSQLTRTFSSLEFLEIEMIGEKKIFSLEIIEEKKKQLESIVNMEPFYKQRLSLLNERDLLIGQTVTFDKISMELAKYSDQELFQKASATIQEEKNYDIFMKKVLFHQFSSSSTFSRENFEEERKKEINKISQILNLQPLLKIAKQKLELESEEKSLYLEQENKQIFEFLLFQEKQKLEEIHRSMNVLLCPQCNTSLRLNGVILQKSNESPSSEKDLIEQTNKIRKFETQKMIWDRKSELQAKINVLSTQIPPHISINPTITNIISEQTKLNYEWKINDLNSMSWAEKSQVTSEQWNMARNIKIILQKIPYIENQLKEFKFQFDTTINFQEKKKELFLITTQIDKYKQQLWMIHSIENKINTFKKQLTDLTLLFDPSIQSLLEEKKKTKEILMNKKNMYIIINELYNDQIHINKLQKTVSEAYMRLYALEYIKKIAIETEQTLLDETVKSINKTLSNIVPHLFENPLLIELSLEKETKKDSKRRSCIHFSISYKGGKYETLEGLSGGESDRISLCISLALSQLHPFPLLLIDECTGSLDHQTKDKCINSIRHITSGIKTVLMIDHEVTQGLFDCTLNMEVSGNKSSWTL